MNTQCFLVSVSSFQISAFSLENLEHDYEINPLAANSVLSKILSMARKSHYNKDDSILIFLKKKKQHTHYPFSIYIHFTLSFPWPPAC